MLVSGQSVNALTLDIRTGQILYDMRTRGVRHREHTQELGILHDSTNKRQTQDNYVSA